MKKIAILIDDMSIKGGSQRISLDLFRYLSKYFNMYFITWYNQNFAYSKKEREEIFYLKNSRSKLRYDIFFLFVFHSFSTGF